MVKRRDIVVTGLGVVSSIGIGREEFWKNLLAGQSGISEVEYFDTSAYDVHMGGEVKRFQPERFLEKKELRRLGRATQFAITATKLALEDAGFKAGDLRDFASAVCLGTTMADAQAIEAFDDDTVKNGRCVGQAMRKYSLQYPASMIAANVATKFHVRGRVFMIPTACAAGNYAIAYGSDLIELGKADVVIAGGVDPFSRIAFTGFSRIFAVAPDRCRQFDRDRKGMIVGEGAGILILESLEHASKRGAQPYARVRGYGTSCDANHMTIPSVEGVARVMQNAIVRAKISPDEVDYISTHGTGTQANDKTECAAIKRVFGDRSHRIPASSIKSMLGHTMGAASALEAISCALVVRYDQIPPTINFENTDPECQIDCVPNKSRSIRADIVLNNSFAFGGNNACVVFEKIRN